MKRSLLLIVLLAGAAAAPGRAQEGPAAAPPSAISGPRDEALRIFDDAATKLVRLAEAIPAEKYTWRPGADVRSVSEVFLHLAAGNFGVPRRLGAQVPANIQLTADFDKSATDKARVIEVLQQSLEHVRKAYRGVADADLEKTVPWLGGRQGTYREIMFFLASHNHEHLGQAIAYARMNGVVPPWTEERIQRQRQQPPQPRPPQ